MVIMLDCSLTVHSTQLGSRDEPFCLMDLAGTEPTTPGQSDTHRDWIGWSEMLTDGQNDVLDEVHVED